MKKVIKQSSFVGAAGLGANSASAATDWSTIVAAVDFSGEISGIVALVGVLAAVLVVRKGARYILGMLK